MAKRCPGENSPGLLRGGVPSMTLDLEGEVLWEVRRASPHIAHLQFENTEFGVPT